MLRLGPEEGRAEQQCLHPEPLNEPGLLDPSFSGCVKVFVVVGDAGSLQKCRRRRASSRRALPGLQPALPNRLMSGAA